MSDIDIRAHERSALGDPADPLARARVRLARLRAGESVEPEEGDLVLVTEGHEPGPAWLGSAPWRGLFRCGPDIEGWFPSGAARPVGPWRHLCTHNQALAGMIAEEGVTLGDADLVSVLVPAGLHAEVPFLGVHALEDKAMRFDRWTP